jgi:hypothetical protein
MPLSGLELLLWAVGLLGHSALLYVLIVRHGVRQFPAFTALIVASIVRTVLLFSLFFRGQNAYAAGYLGMDFVDMSLQLAIVYELAAFVFRPLGRWASDIRSPIAWLAIASILLASGLTWLAVPAANIWERTLIFRAGFFSSALLSELFVGMVVLSVTAGLPWKTHAARIAHGLGAFSIVDVLIEAAHTLHGVWFGLQISDLLTMFRMALYLACLAYWIVTLWQKEPARVQLSAESREHLLQLQARVAYDLSTLRNWRKP